MKQMIYVTLILVALLVAACVPEPGPTTIPTQPAIGMPNPASKFCADQGYKLEIRDKNRAQVGYCVFPDGSECVEWAFYRGECAPGLPETPESPQPAATQEAPSKLPNPASKFCADQGYEIEIRDEAGGQVGYCLFPDGSECEEWAFFRGECASGSAEAEDTPQPADTEEAPAQLPNPASQNCIDQGGTLSIETRPDGGQYGICLFEDNRQCEEWALMRGECPVGGVKVTGYLTDAARFCAISGGTYAITGKSGEEDEQGTCTLPDGSQCDVWAYYEGTCEPAPAKAATPAATATSSGAWASEPTPGAGAISVTADSIPLKDAIANLEPQDVWENFYDLTQVPRPSHHEEQVRELLVKFGQDLGLETSTDDAGNVLIRKPAAAGMEDHQGVILQAHMDMVPQKTPDKDHDFTKDPIEAYVEGEWVTADGTTLGADDGIGLAMIMSILQSETLKAGPVEALFTVNEEDGMDGALGLKPDLLQGDVYINLDWETEGVFCIGAAGGEQAKVQAAYPEVDVPEGMACYELSVAGLKGGHSGVDINLGRGHATKLLVRLLKEASQKDGLRLARLTGGEAGNAIPREASALVCIPKSKADGFLDRVTEFESIFQQELAAVEPDLKVEAAPADPPAQVIEETAQRTLINILYGTPQGVMRMSDAVPGLVETSTNLGIVQVEEGNVTGACHVRSSVDTALDDLGQMIASVWELAGVDTSFSGRYPGWQPDPDSPILALMQDSYQDLYGEEPEFEAIHAGLECGVIDAMYPDMDMISIGPTLVDVHTPDERLEVASVQKVYDLLVATLEQIPEK